MGETADDKKRESAKFGPLRLRLSLLLKFLKVPTGVLLSLGC